MNQLNNYTHLFSLWNTDSEQESDHNQPKEVIKCKWNCWYRSDVFTSVKTMSKIIIGDDNQQDYELDIYQELLMNSPFVKFCWDVQNSWDVKSISPNVSKLLWYSVSDFTTGTVKYIDLIHPDDKEMVLKKTDYKHENKVETAIQTYRLFHKDWHIIYVSGRTINKYDQFGRIKYSFWYIHDITELKATERLLEDSLEKVRNLLLFDKKFWLPNRDKFIEDTENLNEGSLIILRINKFSAFNASFWYKTWDLILREVISKINEINWKFWNNTTLYRLWSVEFWILFKGKSDIKKYISFIEDINNLIIEGINQPISLDFSIGTSDRVEDLYHTWMIAIFKAKEMKTITRYTEELDVNMSEIHKKNVYWVNQIYNAIMNDNIIPVYQWIRDNKTWKIEKYETLCRLRIGWELFLPWVYMEIAKWSHQDILITAVLVWPIIRKIKETWYEFSINLSMNDFTNSDIIEILKDSVIEYDIDPSKLIIEVLEEIPNLNNIALLNIKKLKEFWFQIAIDDFWTWYSNLMRLLELSPDYVKIDWSIIKWCSNDDKKLSVLQMITDFAKMNKIKLIAEFVDNIEDQQVIQLLWIHYSQGYLYSKPDINLIS